MGHLDLPKRCLHQLPISENTLFHCNIFLRMAEAMSETRHTSRSSRSPSLSGASSRSGVKSEPRNQPAQSTKSRLRSGSTTSEPKLDRVYSAAYPDDRSVYHSDLDAASDDDDASGPVKEVRNGVLTERDTDLEKGNSATSKLGKSRSARSDRSEQDPKLVCGFDFFVC